MSSATIITIFTATYNRANTLNRLYKSIIAQTNKNLEWLIVDDGSIDGTADVVKEFIKESIIPIRYFKQENGGKHRAINKGLIEAKGELFYIVDSDDQLTTDSLDRILYYWRDVASEPTIAGVVGFMRYEDGFKIGGGMKSKILDSNLIERRYKYKIQGDLAKVIKTAIFRQFPFPDIKGEKFVAESLIFNRMAEKFKFRYFDETIYICEYLADGLSFNSIKNRRKNPLYACMLYSELANNKVAPFFCRIKAIINYWRFSFNIKFSYLQKLKQVENFPISFFLLPVGFLMFIKDSMNSNVKIN